jgi:hypothetical protein
MLLRHCLVQCRRASPTWRREDESPLSILRDGDPGSLALDAVALPVASVRTTARPQSARDAALQMRPWRSQ